MSEVRVLIGIAFLLFAAAMVIWGVCVSLETRAHRRRMEPMEERHDHADR